MLSRRAHLSIISLILFFITFVIGMAYAVKRRDLPEHADFGFFLPTPIIIMVAMSASIILFVIFMVKRISPSQNLIKEQESILQRYGWQEGEDYSLSEDGELTLPDRDS